MTVYIFPLFSILILCLSNWTLSYAGNPYSRYKKITERISLPKGFKIEIYSDNVPSARSLTLGDNGTVYVGSRNGGKIYALPDKDKDGKPDETIVVTQGLTMPIGVAFLKGDLFVSEVSRIIVLRKVARYLHTTPKVEVVYDWFPKDLHHGAKYLRVGPDGKLYTPVGAPCNICKPKKEIYATITRLNPDGSGFEIFAKGIRNSVGFDWHPETNVLWFTENGRDWLGDDIPPDELNYATTIGHHFGYPYCHAGDIPDPKYGVLKSCEEFTAPAWRFPAHVAPLGATFYRGKQFPKEYHHQLFVAQHGSWNRSDPQGYRITIVNFKNGDPVSEKVFAKGWLQKKGKALGRPVDILEMPDGSLLVSDDKRGVIYKITYINSSG